MREPIGLVFFHGWGLDADFWQPLAARLALYPQLFCDAGYRGKPLLPDDSAALRWVGIGHSLGFARALQTAPVKGWAGLVSIAGFPHFCELAPGSGGQPRRVVERMVRVFAREPHAVLRDFLERCGLLALMPDDAVALDLARLNADLALLLDINVTAQLAAFVAPLLTLAAADDVIVSPQLTASTFAKRPNTRLQWVAQGGHALGFVGASTCAAAITEFLGDL